MKLHLPFEMQEYYQRDGYFLMDHGDVYYGSFKEFDEHPESLFIVQPGHRKQLYDLKKSDRTIDSIKSLAWEIKDPAKIRMYAPGAGDLGNKVEGPDQSWYKERNWKKMFVFGAGASAFSVLKEEEDKFRKFDFSPPIANELFGNKFKNFIRKYKGVSMSQASLKSFGNDVEGFFEDEWKKMATLHNPSLLSRHMNIIYYLRDLFTKISLETIDQFNESNLYSILANKIQQYLTKDRDESVAFVSFNYDTILDSYLSDFFNAPFNSMEDYVNYSKNKFSLFKPHGSVNWGWKFTDDFLEDASITDIPQYLFQNQTTFADLYYKHLGTPFEMIRQNSWGHYAGFNENSNGKWSINKNKIQLIKSKPEHYFPSLLIPYRDKDEMVMPYYHYEQMHNYIHSIQDLYLIGWKGNEKVFNNQLKNASRLRRIFIVNPNRQEVEDNLPEAVLKNKEIIHHKDFNEFVAQDIN